MERSSKFAKERLGVKQVIYRDSPRLAALVNLALMQLKRRGVDISKMTIIIDATHFIGSERLEKAAGDTEMPNCLERLLGHAPTIYLNPAKCDTERLSPILSSNNPLHVIFHEMMHFLHFQRDPKLFYRLNARDRSKPGEGVVDWNRIRNKVGFYAAKDRLLTEFVAEYGTAKLCGREIKDENLENLYAGFAQGPCL